MSSLLGVSVLLISAVVLHPQAAMAESIVIRSGNGVVGGTDSQINMLVGPASGPFPAFTAADFAGARTGPDAFVIDNHPLWLDHLPADSSAEWISTNAAGDSNGNTALYAINFTINSLCFSEAILDYFFAVDNDQGDVAKEGLFMNENPIPGSKLVGGATSNFNSQHSLSLDVTSLVNPGVNTLYIYVVNVPFTGANPSGIQFSATIDVEEITCPIPEQPVGGEIFQTSMVSLFIAGGIANAFWIVPIAGATAGIIGFIVKRRFSYKD